MFAQTQLSVQGITLNVAHDALPSSGPLPHDIVVGPGGASRTLLTLTPRTHFSRAWDVGCGSGVQSVFAATHCDTVIATDIDQRCLDFTAQSAELNNLRIETRLGSFAQPVADESFDLIISNPPFVMGNVTSLIHRESPRPADNLTAELLKDLPAHLNPGGLLVMVSAWLERDDLNWEQAITQWLPDDCNVWVGLRDIQPIEEYVGTWLADAGLTDPQVRTDWIAAMNAWQASAVAFGWIVVWRPQDLTATTWVRTEDVRFAATLPTGDEVWQRLRDAQTSEDLTAIEMLNGRFEGTHKQAWRGDVGLDGLILALRVELDSGLEMSGAVAKIAAETMVDPDDLLIHGLAGLKTMVDLGLMTPSDTPI